MATISGGSRRPSSSRTLRAASTSGTQAPVTGSYERGIGDGIDLVDDAYASKSVGIYRPPKEQGPQQIHFTLSRDGHQVATAQLEQRAIGEGVREVKVTGVIHGVLFVPAGKGPFPGVLVLGGSEEEFRAAAPRGWRHADSPHSHWPTFIMRTCRSN
jgi:hypothetical protein